MQVTNQKGKVTNLEVKYVMGHYEIVSAVSGEFIESADSWDEAIRTLKELEASTELLSA